MCDPEGNGLESLMGVFRLPNSDIRVKEVSFQLSGFIWCPCLWLSCLRTYGHMCFDRVYNGYFSSS